MTEPCGLPPSLGVEQLVCTPPVSAYARLVDRTPLHDALDGWLADGPLSVEELARRAVEAGLVPAGVDDEDMEPEDHIDAIIERSDGYWTIDNRPDDGLVVSVRTFIETGMTFTHRVTAAELDAEALDELPDLSVVLWESGRDGLPLDDGSGSIGTNYEEMSNPRIAGPLGWIEAVHPGDIVVLTRTDRVVSVEVIDEDDVGDGLAEMEALTEAASGWIGDGRGSEELPVVMEAMARNPALFRSPVPPLGELLSAIGLERRGIEWGWAAEEWQTRQERSTGDDHRIRQLYGFDPCCDRAYDRVADAFRSFSRNQEVDGRALADHLGHGAVIAAFVHSRAQTPTYLARFATALVETTSGRHRAPALTLLGLALLRGLDPERAYQSLDAAVRADADFPAAAGALALLELDRGNLSRAHTLAVRDGIDPGLIEWIAKEKARQSALRPTAGRNDPCPCGSGKKFKRCCADGGPLTLDQRVPFVLQRMAHHVAGPDGHETRFGLALSAAGHREDLVEAVRQFLHDPFLVDVAVHEGGLGEEYVDQRGRLLAADEVGLLEQVLDEPRRLWEITGVVEGESLTLRDVGSGDELTVSEHSGSEGREVGELLLARAIVVDDEAMLFGVPLLVPLRERDRVLRLLDDWVDADSLASWFGSLFLPPRMANREGEELVLRRTVCELRDDPGEVIASLDATFERQDDAPVWHEMFTIDAIDRVVRGVLRLDGLLLTVESNSEERQERLLQTLDGLFDYTVIEDRELDEFDLDDLDPNAAPMDPEDMPDEIRELADQKMREYEQRWVDEPIPALGGLTPRQALDDPTRREDLHALLREMRADTPRDALGMSAERIEALLRAGAGANRSGRNRT